MPRYEFTEGTSSKFWEIELLGSSFATTYGKIGANGQTTRKEYKSAAEAKQEYDKLVREKVKKGYQLVRGGKPIRQAAPAKAVAAKASRTKASRTKATPAKASRTTATPTKAAATKAIPSKAPWNAPPLRAATPARSQAAPDRRGRSGERYFELVEGSSSKFWAIAIDGPTVTTRYGKIGTPGQTTVKALDSKAAAYKEHDRLVAEKTRKGYVEKTTAGSAKTNPALEEAIVADPYDREAYSVYADWLQGEGDPRGELIALQLAGKDKAAARLIENHADALLGPLAPHQNTYDGANQPALIWKHGFISRARLSFNHYRDDSFAGSLAEVLEELLRHPSGRFLAELTLVFNNDPNDDDLQDLIDIVARKAPRTLRKLHLGDFAYPHETEMSWYNVGDLGKLWTAVPQLTTLIVQGGSFTLGTIACPT